jgi:hypothetical protein
VDFDGAYSIIQTTDGNYVAAGETRSFGVGQANMYIVKLNPGGNLIWNKTVGGSFFDYATCII